MRESCLKFLDLDFNDLNEQDLDHLLYLYFDGKLEIEEDLFYKNYELALDSFIKNHRDSFLNDKKELSNKMGYYIFCLYGKEKLEKYLTDLNLTQDYMNHFSFYISNNKEKKNVPDYYRKLNDYFYNQLLKEKYKNVDETKMKEAFDIFFDVDNFTERYQLIQRKKAFMEREKIDEQVFKDYVCVYGFEHTSLKETIRKVYSSKYSSYKTLGVNTHALPFYQDSSQHLTASEVVISSLLNTNDLTVLKNIVYDLSLSSSTIYLIYDYHKYIRDKYSSEKEKIIEKVNKATLELEKDYKYISVSKILSIMEKTNDEELIYQIVKNNINKNFEISKFIRMYRTLKSKKEKEQLEDELTFKMKRALYRIKNEERREKEINKERHLKDENIKIIHSFSQLLESENLTLKEFAQKNGFSYSKTLMCFESLKEFQPDFYNKIKKHLDDPKKREFKTILEKINKICYEIIHGVDLEDGTTREFDILDYYSKTNFNYTEFNKLYPKSGHYSVEEKRKIVKFLQKIKSMTYFNMNQELDSKVVLLIHGEMHEVTKDEKLSTMEYLKRNNIPLYYTVYNVALRKFLNGNLVVKEENKTRALKNSGSK